MSHFTTLVLGDNVDEQLAPYDENMAITPYIDSEENQWKEELEKARALNADKEKLASFNPHNVVHFSEGATDQEILDWWSGHGTWIPRKDREGFDQISTYNPESKWDWYVVGGRWDRMLVTKGGETVNETTVGELDITATFKPDEEGVTHTAFAVVKDGRWYEQGHMGWWAMVADEKDQDEWNDQVLKLLAECPPDTKVTLIDAHI